MIGIIGARGFIGRSLIDHFSARHKPVKAYIRKRDDQDRHQLGALPQIYDLSIGQVFDPKIFASVDTVLLAASATHPRTPNNDNSSEMELNVLPHQRLVQALRQTDVKHLIFLSSGGTVYGEIQSETPLTESTPTKPITPYGYGKLCIETLLDKFWTGGDRRLTILRPSNPVGLHQRQSAHQHGLLPTVFENLLTRKTIRVFGDGSTIRDYFAVEDLCELIDRIAADQSGGNAILNVSSGIGCSINEIIQTGSAVLKRPARIHYSCGESPKITCNILANDAARRAHGWAPLKSAAEMFESFLSKERDNQRIAALLNA